MGFLQYSVEIQHPHDGCGRDGVWQSTDQRGSHLQYRGAAQENQTGAAQNPGGQPESPRLVHQYQVSAEDQKATAQNFGGQPDQGPLHQHQMSPEGQTGSDQNSGDQPEGLETRPSIPGESRGSNRHNPESRRPTK